MSPELKRPRLTARLPVIACTPEFLEEVQAFAKKNDVSVSEVGRASLRFFLDANVGNTDMKFRKGGVKASGRKQSKPQSP